MQCAPCVVLILVLSTRRLSAPKLRRKASPPVDHTQGALLRFLIAVQAALRRSAGLKASLRLFDTNATSEQGRCMRRDKDIRSRHGDYSRRIHYSIYPSTGTPQNYSSPFESGVKVWGEHKTSAMSNAKPDTVTSQRRCTRLMLHVPRVSVRLYPRSDGKLCSEVFMRMHTT
ncbi:hypothetical protein BDU57DRAFT_319942 [Ampelomyces quisqualis]|uniref:Secreted protein n=1 Tax=Ampelomyces quisqualis TaxID=50730 RepID=A0A6A5QEG1_AMPQU|nr:hypothetical protein BDU57DRAFT_319942 [Ampelomyces quisqualis]